MSNAAGLEWVADALLESAGFLRGAGRVYTQVQLDRKTRTETRRLSEHGRLELRDETANYLIEHLIDELVDVSGLTAMQEICYRLYACGLGCGNIAATLKLNYHIVAARLRAAERKVRAAYEEGQYAGWHEVYLSEVRRTVKR
jgi:DNA-binding CsgD family transcriptional regulator